MKNGSKPKVMVVDDDRDVLDLLCLVVEKLGVSCDPVTSGEEALERIRSDEFDLLILDKNLPGIDGLETARQARVIQPGVPIALVTGYASEESTSEAVDVGIDDYIKKPIDVDSFRRRVRELLPEGWGPEIPPAIGAQDR
jgi:DNA-binding response OmpR family regulator